MNQILNFVQLTDRVGTSGQPTLEQFADIASSGYQAVINLAMPDSDGALAEEGSHVTALGMDYVHIPVPWDAPRAEHLDRFVGAMRTYRQDKVWVHCAMNLRVSAFMRHYLMQEEGMSDAQASSPILARWAPQMDETWRQFLQAPLGRGG